MKLNRNSSAGHIIFFPKIKITVIVKATVMGCNEIVVDEV
jgi:hypothetical protein